jgi:hypothetical protein
MDGHQQSTGQEKLNRYLRGKEEPAPVPIFFFLFKKKEKKSKKSAISSSNRGKTVHTRGWKYTHSPDDHHQDLKNGRGAIRTNKEKQKNKKTYNLPA